MKIKKIRIKSKENFFNDIENAAQRIDQKLKTRPLKGEYFESLQAVRNVLTEKRLQLWRLIRDQRPDSLLALARLAKRDFKSVYRDISVLIAVGIVELKKQKGKRGQVQRPISLADELSLEVA